MPLEVIWKSKVLYVVFYPKLHPLNKKKQKKIAS